MNINELTAKLKAAAQLSKELWGIANYSKGKAAKAEFEELSNEDNILALTEALEAAERRIAEIEQLLRAAENNEMDARCHVAELEARTLTVKLPQRYSMLHRLDFDEPYHTEMVYKQSEVLEVLAAAGIKLQVEGEE